MNKLVIETSSKSKIECLFKNILDNLHNFEFTITEDNIALGDDSDFIVIGLKFLVESSLSGITWDYIKYIIKEFYKKMPQTSKTNIEASIIVNDNKNMETFKLLITTEKNNITIKLPDNINITIKTK